MYYSFHVKGRITGEDTDKTDCRSGLSFLVKALLHVVVTALQVLAKKVALLWL